jgi:hypothetical protein
MTERVNLLQVAQILAVAASNTLVIYLDGPAGMTAYLAAVRELEMKK